MPKAYSLHVGVGYFDSAHYGGTTGSLKGAHNDALLISRIARANGFTTSHLLAPLPHEAGSGNAGAYSDKLLTALSELAAKAEEGDMVLVSFSGNGGHIPDTDDLDISDGKYDKSWCLYDRQVLEDEIYQQLLKFRAGVRVLLITDCCHCADTPIVSGQVQPRNIKSLSHKTAIRTYFDNRSQYQEIRARKLPVRPPLQASVLQLAACEDGEMILDGYPNSVFTKLLENIWENGLFDGDYRQLQQHLREQAKPYDLHPQLLLLSATGKEAEFMEQRPFSVYTGVKKREANLPNSVIKPKRSTENVNPGILPL